MTRFSDHGMLGTWLIGDAEEEAARRVIRSRSLFRYYGPQLLHETAAFERAVAEVTGLPHALAMSSGTAALRSALAALRLPPGAEVLVPPCTFAATVNAVVLAGGVPVFCEIDDSLGLDPDRLRERMTPRTVGIIAVHLQGFSCQIDAIRAVADAAGLWLIEDCAQALGVQHAGRHVGGFGAFGAFSLQAHKTITCGEGGLLVSDDAELFGAAARFHDQGGVREGNDYPTWEHPGSGFGENLKMSELHAAVAHAQLARLPTIRKAMRARHAQLIAAVDFRGRARRTHPDPAGGLPYSITFFARDAADRAHVLDALAARSVPADGLYDEPLYQSGPFQRWSRGEAVLGCPDPSLKPRFEPCPHSEALMARLIRIPLSPAYDDDDMNYLAEALDASLAGP